MKTIHSIFVWGLFALILAACGRAERDEDRTQKLINEQAYLTRFNRQTTDEQSTGIQIAPDSERTGANYSRNVYLKSVLMSGDDSIRAFDNARKMVTRLFSQFGIAPGIQLSRASAEQKNGVRATSVNNLEQAARDLKITEDEGCLVFMTSHGSQSSFYIKGQNGLTPSKMNQILKDACGNRPTVLLVSACYSGIFAEPAMQAPNRIILTAARKDKTSFGCSAEAQYTYWDSCLIENLPLSNTWLELAGNIEKCIQRKETGGGFSQSYPQARFGADVKDLNIAQ